MPPRKEDSFFFLCCWAKAKFYTQAYKNRQISSILQLEKGIENINSFLFCVLY